MRVPIVARRLRVMLPFLFLAGCDGGDPVSGLREEEQPDPDAIYVTGTVSTPFGDRVEFVNVRLYGVYGDSLNPSYALLARGTTDATGAFSVAYPDCHEYPRFFVDLEIACFPIGLREVGCGAWALEFVWNPMGSSGVMAPCLESGFGAAPEIGIGNAKNGNNIPLLPYSSSKGSMAPMSVGRHAGGGRP